MINPFYLDSSKFFLNAIKMVGQLFSHRLKQFTKKYNFRRWLKFKNIYHEILGYTDFLEFTNYHSFIMIVPYEIL